jgi:hypothetical protein
MALRSPDLNPFWRDLGLEGYVLCCSNSLFAQYLEDYNLTAIELQRVKVEVEGSLAWTTVLCS